MTMCVGRISLVSAALLLIGYVIGGAGAAGAASSPSVMALSGHVPIEATRLIPAGRAEALRQIRIQVSLKLRNRAND